MSVYRRFLWFLFLLQNIDCGYSLEPPRKKNPMKISIFTDEKNLCILHGRVFVLSFLNDLGRCFDLFSDCAREIRNDNNYCTDNPEAVRGCRESCGLCGSIPKTAPGELGSSVIFH